MYPLDVSLLKSIEKQPRRPAAAVKRELSGEEEGKITMLDHLVGLLKLRVVRGVNLAVRDLRSSDPYVVVRIGKQKLKTRVVKKSVNPEWDDELTLSIEDPAVPIRLEVFDKDTFVDDTMGNAEVDIRPLVEIVKMKLQDVADRTVVKKLVPNRQNCLAEESSIYISEGKVKQDMVVRLRNVESGEIELQLQWIDLPGSKGV
ncbi:Protein C2-DOMAIN ABA-RELATED 4 [Zea mays]|uniref:Protein C2-DOMAIN ABA-RELATED 4 n=3 Tax=Zea mays TaxID=4577 RepID=A0A1D6NIB5_MAIZE|nr:Protein C2-DOMAIN ABA-RELATED 4 [Zea mays]